MSSQTPNPFAALDLASFARMLRDGTIGAEAVTRACLSRIAAFDSRIGSFTHVAADSAIATARGVDAMLRAGVDLGPLMGMPTALKDLFFVDGMPTRAGSRVDIADLVGPEGSLIRKLKRQGAIILGKLKQSEFALATTISHDTPWNPWDLEIKRQAGTSSGGSAVAMACGFVAFTIGTDAGGSVRQPAALNGVVGYKSTVGYLPTDGALELTSTFDSVGTFHASAADAAYVLAGLRDEAPIMKRPARGLRLGLDRRLALADCAPEVAARTEVALAALSRGGVELVAIDMPGAAEVSLMAGKLVPAEMVAYFGRERLLANRERIDPVAWERLEPGLALPAHEYIALLRLHRRLVGQGLAAMEGLDGWVMPTVSDLPLPVRDFATVERARHWNARINGCARLVNYLGQCAVSLPLSPPRAGDLPVGLQLVCAPGADRQLLAIAMGVEDVLGRAPPPPLA